MKNGWFARILNLTLCLVLILLVMGGLDTVSAKADDHILGKDNAGSMTFTLYAGEYAITQDEEGLDVIQMEGFSSIILPGDPMLPHKVYNIAVSPDIVWSSLTLNIVSAETSLLDGIYDVKPAGPDIAWSDDKLIEDWGQAKDIINGENMEVYGTDAEFPESYLELLPYSQMRKWKYIKVDFTPFQYNPVSQKLTLIESVTIEITYEQSGIEPQAKLMNDTVMDDVAAQVFINYQQVKSMYRPGATTDASSVTYDYVIITTNAIEANSSKLASFISHKESQGHSVLVITEDEFGGLAGQAPNHEAEKIRKWLIDNYAAMGIEYVLLIGDPHPYESGEGDIPMKMCWPRLAEVDYQESPTDYFYADLTGNWDYDGDGYYGEWSDDYPVSGGVDFAPEVYVGRIPVYGADYSTLDSILQKIIDYETEASIDWRQSVLLPMGFQWEGYDGAALAEQMRDDYLNAAGFSSWRMYQQGNGACGLDSTYTSDEELRGGTVVRDRWAANDYGIVCWWAHGSETSTSVGYDGCWDGTLFQSSYCSSLDDDHPSFTYQCSCTNGYPENSNNLQYAILKQGGISTVSATRVSVFNTGVGYGDFDGSTTNSGIGYEYISRLISDNPAGQALYSTKNSMTPANQNRLLNWYDFNLYGDPTTSLASGLVYCTCGGTTYDEEWISRVQFNTIDKSSGGDGCADYTSISTDVTRGSTYTLTVTIDQVDSYSEYVKAYFDWNQDGDFEDSGEGIEIGHCSSDGCTVSAGITIPGGATLGSTRMRIVNKYNSYGGPCETYTYGDTEDYTVNVQEEGPINPPTVTNNGGATDVTSNSARLNGEVTSTGGENPTVYIYWGDNDGGTTPANWDHQENLGTKGAGTFYQDISGLNPDTTYYYRCYAENSEGSDWADSTALFTTLPLPPPVYCDCGGTTYDEEWISRVQFNTIDKSSGGSGYADYTSISTDVTRGSTYTLTVTIDQVDSYSEYVKAYFDWNQDGDFEDSGEGIEIGHCSSDGCTVSAGITIPGGATLGSTRMRIVNKYNSYGGPCETYTYGDTEDYTVNVQEEGPINPPTVTNNGGATDVTSNSARLNGEVTSTGGENPTVYIYWGDNDGGTTPANWDHQENLGTKGAGTFYQDISGLNPDTTYYYRCYAENSAGSDWADSTASFTTPTSEVDYWAVIVGVADYPGTVNDLDYTDDDAYDVRDALLAGTNWEASHITLLIDSDATKANIHNAIDWMGSNGDVNDAFFFFFSGHGTTIVDQSPFDEADNLDEVLAQYDFGTAGFVSDDELGDWIAALPGGPEMAVIDTCFSGGMIKTSEGQSKGLLGAGIPQEGDGFFKDLDDVVDGVVLTASDDDEVSWETSELQNSLFTYYFIEGLAGLADANSNDEVSMEEIFDYLYPLVVNYPVSPVQHPQEYDNWPGEALVLFTTPDYCTCGGTTYDEEWISRVQFNTIDKSSGGSGYADYTSISTDVTKGSTYTLTVTIDQVDSYSEYVKAYFDWNQDGDFEDSGEGIEIGHCSSDGCTVSAGITIPGGATLGSTRMRIVQKYNSYGGPCETYTYGDTEDYTVNIQNSS